jgi:hypothetical protein
LSFDKNIGRKEMRTVIDTSFAVNVVACCLKAGLPYPRPIAKQRLTTGHVPVETKTASCRCVKKRNTAEANMSNS